MVLVVLTVDFVKTNSRPQSNKRKVWSRRLRLNLVREPNPDWAACFQALKSLLKSLPFGEYQLEKTAPSPAFHSAFSNADEMLDFVERLADISGLPIGIKSAVGEMSFWDELISLMSSGSRGVDFIAIDGAEGGTGAAPLTFSDHVALPFKLGFTRVYKRFEEANLADKIFFMGSGKLGFPETGLLALSLGCDALSIAREPMLAIGCIQAQKCHSGHCPTGVATQSKWLMRGLDPTLKSNRLANYLITLRKELMQLTHACGFEHPAQITPSQFEIADDQYGSKKRRRCLRIRR